MLRALLALTFSATSALAVIPEDEDTPPAPTPTTTTCDAGQVWDADSATCIAIEQSRLPEDTLRRTARELAYADRTADALALLALSDAPASSDVLTLTAFAHGRAGDYDTALTLYDAALTADPDNLLARAYMGLALIAAGRPEDAVAQQTQIRARGGTDSWPDRALTRGIEAGAPIGY
jgi:tetratricopeptide (TPR) repeat protein